MRVLPPSLSFPHQGSRSKLPVFSFGVCNCSQFSGDPLHSLDLGFPSVLGISTLVCYRRCLTAGNKTAKHQSGGLRYSLTPQHRPAMQGRATLHATIRAERRALKGHTATLAPIHPGAVGGCGCLFASAGGVTGPQNTSPGVRWGCFGPSGLRVRAGAGATGPQNTSPGVR